MANAEREIRIDVPGSGAVSGLLRRPADARALLVLAHGAGAGMRHRFMAALADALAARGVATLRYQFPYMEAGGRRPDRPAVAHAAVRAAVDRARTEAPDLPIHAGGKSFGGRMTSQAAADTAGGGLPGVQGLVFLGFPLHPPGKRTVDRADHLADVPVPMLFVQGTRDSLAALDLLRPVVEALGERAALHIIEGGDHSFKVLKSVGLTEEEVLARVAEVVQTWAMNSAARRGPVPSSSCLKKT